VVGVGGEWSIRKLRSWELESARESGRDSTFGLGMKIEGGFGLGFGGFGLEMISGSRMFRVGSKASIEFWESIFLSFGPKNRLDMDPGDLGRRVVSP
jgi:hypothetical protein